MPAGKTIDAAEGATLLEALLSSSIAIPHKCEGKAECGSCHIFVHDGRKGLSRMGPAENAKLDSIVGVGSKSRLACQARLGAENVTIELLGFSSGL
jgi:2Fe-2S ferredoxin